MLCLCLCFIEIGVNMLRLFSHPSRADFAVVVVWLFLFQKGEPAQVAQNSRWWLYGWLHGWYALTHLNAVSAGGVVDGIRAALAPAVVARAWSRFGALVCLR